MVRRFLIFREYHILKALRRFQLLCAAPALLTPNWRTKLSYTIKGRHAQGTNPEPVIPLALSLISMYNNYRCEYCIPVARISGGDLDTAHVLF